MAQKKRFFRRYNTNSSAFLPNRRGVPFTKRRIQMVEPFPEREMDDGKRSCVCVCVCVCLCLCVCVCVCVCYSIGYKQSAAI